MIIIRSKKIILRPFKKGDLESLTKILNDKEIYKNTLAIPYPYRIKHAKDWINFNLKQNRKKNKTAINFVIELRGELIGGIGLSNIVDNHKTEIGYWVGKDYRGQGVATEAIRLITDYAFHKLKLKRVYATIFPWNEASKRVVKNNNYKFEGILKKYHKKYNKFIDACFFSKIK
jgi:RimJ/RimL family protein N-acetyltransferase